MSLNPVDVAIGVLTEDRGDGLRVLITLRPDEVVLAGHWEFPGGKVEPGEPLRDCLAREFTEELGLTIQVGRALPIIEHRYDHALVRLHPFLCQRLAGEPRNLAVRDHRWVKPGELRDHNFPAGNTTLIDQVIEMLA